MFLKSSGRRREVHVGDRVFLQLLRAVGVGIVILLISITAQVFMEAWPVLKKLGPGFLTFNEWDPVNSSFGGLAFIYGTLVSSFLALLIAVPISVGSALFLNEIAPKWLSRPVSFLIEMLAAIPSVIYGLWGIFVMAPWLRTVIQPWLGDHLGMLPLFQGAPFGVGMMSAGLVLAIMITPTICAIAREVFNAVPNTQREAALGLGATRSEMIRVAVVRSSYTGILGAVILGLGRALGETMAVTMVIGNRPQITASLFAPAQTMASVIANEYGDASGDEHRAALAAIGFSLLLVSLVVNGLARLLVWQAERKLK